MTRTALFLLLASSFMAWVPVCDAQTVSNSAGVWQRKNWPVPVDRSDSGTIGQPNGNDYQKIVFGWILGYDFPFGAIEPAKSHNLTPLPYTLQENRTAMESWDYRGSKHGEVEENVQLRMIQGPLSCLCGFYP